MVPELVCFFRETKPIICAVLNRQLGTVLLDLRRVLVATGGALPAPDLVIAINLRDLSIVQIGLVPVTPSCTQDESRL